MEISNLNFINISPDTLKNIFATLAFLGGAIATSYKMYKVFKAKHIDPFVRKVENIDNYIQEQRENKIELHEFKSDITKKLAEIQKEVIPNGGNSLKDQTVKILNQVNILQSTNNALIYLDQNPIFKTDEKGNCTFVNQKWLDITGFTSQEDALGVGWLRAIDELDRQQVAKDWRTAIETSSVFIATYNYKHIHTKKLTKVNARTTVIRENNKIVSVLGVAQLEHD